ncbi:hypothetical protein EYW98_23370 [Escherichia coli]|nr:hypothetical protein [Escherichia coli]EGO8379719.1 hypothetical protein [Escherichia coli]
MREGTNAVTCSAICPLFLFILHPFQDSAGKRGGDISVAYVREIANSYIYSSYFKLHVLRLELCRVY